MLTILFICLCLGSNAYADYIDSSLAKEELTKIATTCLTNQDFELLAGNTFRYQLVESVIYPLIEESVMTIGLEELRTALKLSPLPPWKPHNQTKPSEHELALASTIEEYYNLREPRSKKRSLDSPYFFQHNIDTAVTYLNERVPTIQTIFKKTFEEVCPSSPEVLDKKEIDSMIELYHATAVEVQKATSRMLFYIFECRNVN
ncbi:unnamed protein product [Auanema sp. JU1783]|nr:unnamed protein product [Auanema sp. JU1783]